jgi:trans-2,3-dihydro-3-hydroxyanthranilate isomerase
MTTPKAVGGDARLSRSYEFETFDVFTRRRFGGNPLAVVHDALGLSDREMQTIAAEFNLSETIFLLPPTRAANDASVRIFNRTHEMPFAGHPTIGAAVALARRRPNCQAKVINLEAPAGVVSARLEHAEDGLAYGAEILAPQPLSTTDTFDPKEIAACAGLQRDDIITSAHLPCLVSMGVTFVVAEVREDALGRSAPNVAAFRAAVDARPHLKGRFSLHLYVRDGRRLRARMFAPLAGTQEDPATGSANGPLAALLLQVSGDEEATFDIRQGVEMGRPSELRVRAYRAPDGIRAEISGGCVQVMRGQILV